MDMSKMYEFSDYDIGSVNFQGRGGKSVLKMNKMVATDPVDYDEAETNTDKPDEDKSIQASEYTGTGKVDEAEADESDLSSFLSKTSVLMMEAITENTNLRALDDYDVMWGTDQKDISCLYTLNNAADQLTEHQEQLEITDISWNSTGLTLAAAYGKFEHTGMSYHKSFVCIWNISRRDFKPDEPSIKIETTGSIMCVEFHPTKPSILAGGSFNGEIFIWDITRQDENLLYSSRIDDYFHREAISQIIWLEQKLVGKASSIYNLMSLSTDGKVLVWAMEHQLKFPSKGYTLVRKKDGMLSFVGGLAITQSTEEKTCFVLGTEAGSVFRCVINNISHDKKQRVLFEQKGENIRWKEETLPVMLNVMGKNVHEVKLHVEEYCKEMGITEIKWEHIFQSKPDMRKLYTNPIAFAYEVHNGPVYSTSFSPFHRNIFLSSSLDGSIKLFELLQNKPLLSIDQSVADQATNYVFKADWSPLRPTVFATASSGGHIGIYDLMQSKSGPVYTLKNDDNRSGGALNLKFNRNQLDLLAGVYPGCVIKVYQLNQSLCNPLKNEMQFFETLSAEST